MQQAWKRSEAAVAGCVLEGSERTARWPWEEKNAGPAKAHARRRTAQLGRGPSDEEQHAGLQR
jgi:hypothetical protein